MEWTDTIRSIALSLASPDAAIRDRALEDALALEGPELELVSEIDRHLTRWSSRGYLKACAGGVSLSLFWEPDWLVRRLLAELPLVELRCCWSWNAVMGAVPGLTEVPEEWLHASLEVLDLSGHRLARLPERLTRLPRLRELHLDGNVLDALPEEIGELVELEVLTAAGNRLRAVPRSIGRLARLRVLNLSSNQLSALPDELGELVALEELELGHNLLQRLPETLEGLGSLHSLNAEFNQLVALPEHLGRLARLRELRLAGNALERLPLSICQLSAVEGLYLSDNRLRGLPKDIGLLRLLERLVLHRNRISELPEGIVALPLYCLSLAGNPLQRLPRAIEAMTELTTIVLNQDGLDRETQRWLGQLRLNVYEEDPDEA